MSTCALRRALLLVLMSLQTACAVLGPYHAYPGPKRGSEELGLIRSGLPQRRDAGCVLPGEGIIKILEVDGKTVLEFGQDAPRSVYVLPGKHTIKAEYLASPRAAGDLTSSELYVRYYFGESSIDVDVSAGEILQLVPLIDQPNKRFRYVPVRMSATDCWPGDK